PTTIKYDVSQLKNFLKNDDDLTIIFYGGEPLLQIDKMKLIMDEVPAKRFILQTNGLLLNNLEKKYVEKFHTILVSIDGNEKLTDYYRGKGVYKKIIENLKLLKDKGFKGELIARMTVSDATEDVYRQVLWLLFNPNYQFKSIHWQLDALFWRNDFKKRNFLKWVLEKYNPQVNKLIEFWVKHMEKYGKVLKIYPFIGLVKSMLLKEKTKLRCGAGWTTFNIQTDGNITPCPVMAGIKNFYLGNIWDTTPKKLKNAIINYDKPCNECSFLNLCGGRCLYANITKLWGEEGFKQVCLTVKNLIITLKKALPKIKKLISKGRINLEDFHYQKFNSCEIIP
ncbi:MAG: TIGR04084 family radical SAM/SPASM domain-containing protein, partial [Candidatus Bathyarchaeia archaeon]